MQGRGRSHALELFNTTLGNCFLDFIAGLPATAKAMPEDFSKREELEAFASFPRSTSCRRRALRSPARSR